MRPSLRFLTLAVIGWAGFRAATLGALPGVDLVTVERSAAKVAPIVPTQFPDLPPVEPVQPAAMGYDYATAMPPPIAAVGAYPRPLVIPVYYQYRGAVSAPVAHPAAMSAPVVPMPGPRFDLPGADPDPWPLSRLAAAAALPPRPHAASPVQLTPAAVAPPRFDRVQLTMWAMLRGRQGLVSTPQSLASGGTLGGSQAGARLFYNFSPQIAAVLRTSSEVGRRGGEVAAGVRVRPLRSLPLWVTAERRQALGKFGGGRSAFALFAETGLYGQPMPWGFLLDGYAQAGVVGFKSRDLFADGGVAVSRPVYRQFSAGFGVWGGVQPGLYRVDAGPRVTMKVRRNLSVHLDWRQRLAGNAEPGSGPVVTLAGDF
jgi:hypothetical protein